MYATRTPSANKALKCKEKNSLSELAQTNVWATLLNYTCDLDYGTLDTRDFSCANGWTTGNVISTAAEVAEFTYALFGHTSSIVSESTQKEMLTMQPFTEGDMSGVSYGMGVFTKTVPTNPPSDLAWMYGHSGADYGSYTNAQYNPLLGFSLVVSTTNESYLHYRMEDDRPENYVQTMNNPHAEDTWCAVLDAVLEVFTSIDGGLPSVDREHSVAQLGGWDGIMGYIDTRRFNNSCYLCRLAEGVPRAKVKTDTVRRRRTTFNANDDDD